jgi:hypothetical protein
VSAIALLMGLLLLSYLGSLILGGRTARGLPSGIEFVGLGFIVGPRALSMVDTPMIAEFEPIVQVALGWLAFVVGLDFGRVGGRRLKARSIALGVSGAVLTGVIVAFTVYELLAYVKIPGITGINAIVMAAGAGAVTCETTRFGIEWVSARWSSKGPVTNLLVELGASDDLAPFVVAGAIFALAPTAGSVTLPAVGWFALSTMLGGLLGTVTALLLRSAEGYQVWGALVGTLLLGVGISARFGLCTIYVTFAMGIALAAVSPSRRVLRRMVSPTERAVLYPMLLLAGARIDPRPLFENRMLAALVALVLLARIVGKLLSGLLVRAVVPKARPAGRAFGMVLLSSGPVSLSCGFVFALRFPGAVGDSLLILAAASAVLGEVVSTLAMKGLLDHVGELPPPGSASTAPAVSDASAGPGESDSALSVAPPPPSSSPRSLGMP